MLRHNFKKQFGQNFLKSKKFPKEMVNALDIKPTDTIFEIGPGDGILTDELIKTGAKVVSIEIDYDLIPKLVKRFSSNENYDLMHIDFMDLDLKEAFEKYAKDSAIKFAGSLPYNISKRIIRKILDFNLVQNKFFVSKMAFIVQEEVAKDYIAKAPNSSNLSTLTHIYAKTKKLISIPASQFHPVPKVNGAILVLEPYKDLELNTELEKLIKIAFSAPRKTLKKNLKNSNKYISEQIDAAISKLGLNETVRAHELDSSVWKELLKLL